MNRKSQLNCVLAVGILAAVACSSQGCSFISADSSRFELFDARCPPAAQTIDNLAENFTAELPADNQMACTVQCALRSGCAFLRFDLDARVCKMSNRVLGMAYHRADTRLSACRKVCRGSRLFCIFQQRLTDSVNFNRPWQDYEQGFGDSNNFWIGLELLHLITSLFGGRSMRAEIFDWSDALYVAEYSGFAVAGASTQFTMTYWAFESAKSNVSGDSLTLNNGKKFSTTDRDNDDWGGSCSNAWHGGAGWWFGRCTNANPNGLMTSSEVADSPQSLHWLDVRRNKNSLKAIRLMVELPTDGS